MERAASVTWTLMMHDGGYAALLSSVAMGRKKIKIQRIEDDRNRQVGTRAGHNTCARS